MVKSNFLKRIFKKFSILVVLLLFIQCASVVTNVSRYREVELDLRSHKFSAAVQNLKQQKEEKQYTKKDRLLYFLDLGISYYYAKQWQQSNSLLQDADDTIENLYTKSASKLAGSFLLNDNILEYSGEDYENIYVNIFKCINYIKLDDFEDAFVEVRKFNEKIEKMSLRYDNLITNLNKLKDVQKYDVKFQKGEIKFHNSAIAKYLSLLMYRATGNYDDANIDRKSIDNIWKTQPDIYDFPQPTALKTSLEKIEKPRLNLISFTGLGPIKEDKGFRIATHENHITVTGIDFQYKGRIYIDVEKGYYFKFSLPEIKKRKSQVHEVKVWVDGEIIGNLQTIESFSNVAKATFQVKKPIIYLKTILRTIMKGLTAQKQKENIDKETDSSLLGALANVAIDMAVDISENADLRCWRLMPDKCSIGEFSVPAGNHNITIQYLDKNQNVIYNDVRNNYHIKKGNLNLINSACLK
ncbi:MAG: hypothetical protein KGY74_04015 [Candidatus Cloacimonetes bacterium]|nr:hypothetical protein [Candidatus Cloacimonadota bacterium]